MRIIEPSADEKIRKITHLVDEGHQEGVANEARDVL